MNRPHVYFYADCLDLLQTIPNYKYQSPQSLPGESLVTPGVRDGKPSRSGKRPRLRNKSQRVSSAPPQELAKVENGAGERVGPAC